jgi:hypothetical protein
MAVALGRKLMKILIYFLMKSTQKTAPSREPFRKKWRCSGCDRHLLNLLLLLGNWIKQNSKNHLDSMWSVSYFQIRWIEACLVTIFHREQRTDGKG